MVSPARDGPLEIAGGRGVGERNNSSNGRKPKRCSQMCLKKHRAREILKHKLIIHIIHLFKKDV